MGHALPIVLAHAGKGTILYAGDSAAESVDGGVYIDLYASTVGPFSTTACGWTRHYIPVNTIAAFRDPYICEWWVTCSNLSKS